MQIYHMLFGAKASFGLDIGSSCIKAVQLKEKRGGYELGCFETVQLPPELIVDGSIIDSIRLVEMLKQLVGKARIRTKNVAIGLAGHASVIIKRISLPEMPEEELAESIKFEAEQYVPFDIEDVNVDFQILGPRKDGQMDVMLAAVKKDVVNEYVSVVREAGLTPFVVDVDAFALSNMHEINYDIEPGVNVALVNVGAHTINLNVVKNGVSVFTRDSAIGVSGVTEALQKEFHLPYEVSEKLQRGELAEDASPAGAREVMAGAYEEIAGEVTRSLEYFREANLHEEAGKVILSGGGALIKDFPRVLAEKTGLVVDLAEPFRNISLPKQYNNAETLEMAPIAAVAAGLALRRPEDKWSG